jgi:GNAT superfamily N-acetyltransferase
MSWTLYRHYKGNHYLRLGVGAHSEDLSPHVIYRCLYDNPEARTWIRPQGLFEETLEDGRPRFTPVARIRLVQPEDLPAVLAFGYDAWGDGKSLADFVVGYEQSRHHLRGTRYLLETLEGVPVAGLNTLRFRRGLMGLASVATDPAHRGKGHSALLVRGVMEFPPVLGSAAERVRAPWVPRPADGASTLPALRRHGHRRLAAVRRGSRALDGLFLKRGQAVRDLTC